MRMSSINDTGSDRLRAGKSVACKMILTSPNLSLSLEIVKNHDVSTHWSMSRRLRTQGPPICEAVHGLTPLKTLVILLENRTKASLKGRVLFIKQSEACS